MSSVSTRSAGGLRSRPPWISTFDPLLPVRLSIIVAGSIDGCAVRITINWRFSASGINLVAGKKPVGARLVYGWSLMRGSVRCCVERTCRYADRWYAAIVHRRRWAANRMIPRWRAPTCDVGVNAAILSAALDDRRPGGVTPTRRQLSRGRIRRCRRSFWADQYLLMVLVDHFCRDGTVSGRSSRRVGCPRANSATKSPADVGDSLLAAAPMIGRDWVRHQIARDR